MGIMEGFRGSPVAVTDAQKCAVDSNYKVVRACSADVDNRYDVQLQVGEILEWIGGESSGSMYIRKKDNKRVFVRREDENCIKVDR